MGNARIKLIRSGMEELLESGEVGEFVAGLGEAVAAQARSTAVVESGEYRDSIFAAAVPASSIGITFRTGANGRTVAMIGTSAAHGLVVEAKTGNLARALDAAG